MCTLPSIHISYALRALERMCEKSKKVTAQVEKCRTVNPETFRAIAVALKTQEKHSRTQAMRERAVTFITTMVRSLSVQRKTGYLLLTKDEYVCYKGFNSGMPKDVALKNWEIDRHRADAYTEADEDT